MARNGFRTFLENDSESYRDIFEKRNVKSIRQYVTPNFVYPSPREIAQLTKEKHLWVIGDRWYKLADRFYGDPTYWWIIAMFNKKPTEAHVKVGDIVYIPLPLEKAVQLFGV